MYSDTLCPGNWPPSPGLAPWAILIWIWSELTRYSVVTPKRADDPAAHTHAVGTAQQAHEENGDITGFRHSAERKENEAGEGILPSPALFPLLQITLE